MAALLVALVIGGSYPYVVLKLGFGPNISVVSAFFGYLLMVMLLRRKDFTRWENNIVQTAGTSAGQTAFMCVLLAAFLRFRKVRAVLTPRTIMAPGIFGMLQQAGDVHEND